MAYPENDPHWDEIMSLARKHIGKDDVVVAENSMLQFFPKGVPYLLMTRRGMLRADWIIFHKEYVMRIAPRITRDLLAHCRPVFANDVFVVFAGGGQGATSNGPGEASPWADFHPGHVETLRDEANRMERDQIPLQGMYLRMLTDYDQPTAVAGAVRDVVKHLFSPRVLVVRLKAQGGFFACFNRVMSHLMKSLHHDGIRAVLVEWNVPEMLEAGLPDTDHFPYGKPGDGNIWEHFFEPIPTSFNPAWPKVETRFSADLSTSGVHTHYVYKGDSGWREKYNAAYRKYIRLLPRLQAKVDEFHAANLAGRHVIGVHVRNSAHQVEYITGRAPGFEAYVAKIREEIARCDGEWVILLATDVEEAVQYFTEAFAGRVVMQQGVTRLLEKQTGDNRQQLHHANTGRDLKLGEDVVIDCLLLAKSDVLIHTISNLATTAGYINPSMKMVYLE